MKGALEKKRTMEEKKRAEEALQASEIRYRRLFESAKEGILLLDVKTRVCRRVFRRQRIVASVANSLEHQTSKINALRWLADVCVYANREQKTFLVDDGFPRSRLFYNPFYVDETVFVSLKENRRQLAAMLGLDHSLLTRNCSSAVSREIPSPRTC